MALIDTYRNNVMRKRKDLSTLNERRGKENSKIFQLRKKILSAQQAISRSKMQSIINSKLKEIDRAEAEILKVNKKIVEYDKQINSKQRELDSEVLKLEKEEGRMLKKKNDEEQRRIKENQRQMQELMERPTEQYINNGGQMNVAKDNAVINATYYHCTPDSRLDELIGVIKNSDLSVFTDEEQEVLIDNIDVLEEQLNSENPKRGFIKTALTGLTTLIYKSAELTEPLQKLIEFAESHIK